MSYVNIILKNMIVFLYTPFLLKYLGQAEYGLYQMTNSVIMSLSILSMGFSSAYVRFYMRFKTKKDIDGIKKLNGMYLLLFIGISILSLIIGSLLVSNVNYLFNRSLNESEIQTTKLLMSVMVFNIALTFPASVFDSNIMVHEQFRFQQTRQVIQTILAPILTVPLIFMGFKSVSIVMITTLVTLIFLIVNIRYATGKLKMKFSFKNLPLSLLKEITFFSFFLFLGQIIDLINNNVPSFIIGMISGAEDVAVYAVAGQIKGLFFMLSTALSGVFIPYINELVSNQVSKLKLTELMIKVGRTQLIMLTFILGGFIAVGKYFIVIWAGTQNELAYIMVILMILPVLVPLSQNVGIEIQRAMNMHYFRSIVYIIFAILNILITAVSVKYIGVIGSVFGYVITIFLANGVAMNWYYHKKMNLNMFNFWKKVSNIFIPFFCATAITYSLQLILAPITLSLFFILGGGYAIIYILVYYFIAATPDERTMIRKIIDKLNNK